VKPRFAIWFSLFAVILLILIQYYSISEMYRIKKEQFDNRYGQLVYTAMVNYNLTADQAFDSLFYAFDNYARQMIIRREQLLSDMDEEAFKQTVINEFSVILNSQKRPDKFVRQFLESQDAETDFKSGYYIHELYLIDFDELYPVYTDTAQSEKYELSEALQAYSYTSEGNYYRIGYDFYIDFTHKSRIIYREMIVTLILAFITILIVSIVFYLTVKNMLLQKKLSDLKTDFINNMTHELKTPLSTIAVATSSLSDEKFLKQQERVKEISALIKKQNRHLTQLIDRILDISIWEKDQVRLEKRSVHILEFFKEKLDSLRIEYKDLGLKIHEDYDLDKDYVKLDEVHMTTVLNNLISNAVKYCDKTPEVFVKVSVKDSLSIRIKDNGIGISREEQKYVFDKFYRSGHGDYKTVKGLGLGLYYVKQIITAHGGEIFVNSQPGKGTAFNIHIPLNNEHTAGRR
jgi:two-component system phosphate regulon sensor histidine kinase PhoR